jgi:hypothetical protein
MQPIDVYIVPSADAPVGVGLPGLPLIANTVAALTGKVPHEFSFKLG